ncbi:hypothetical protein BgiBS90_000066 [Biomphalaria glabrata]|nr:hypothetical protein BgiBS90_000066 [Biomphalaria glabrata]
MTPIEPRYNHVIQRRNMSQTEQACNTATQSTDKPQPQRCNMDTISIQRKRTEVAKVHNTEDIYRHRLSKHARAAVSYGSQLLLMCSPKNFIC